MPHIWLQAIKRQDHLLLFFQLRAQPFFIRQMECEQFFITIELIGHSALGHLETASQQFFMDLWDAALLPIAQHPHQRNHVQSELPMRQRPPTFFLWPCWLVEAWASCISAPIDG